MCYNEGGSRVVYMKKIAKIMKNKWKIILFYVFIFFIFLFNFAILNNFSEDNHYNYGFAYNIVNGLIPYLDYNMVLFPFAPFLIAVFLKIFGTKLIVYYAVSSLFGTLTIYFVSKLKKELSLLILILLLMFPIGGYNYLMVLLFFVLLYLEKNNANDYLIGLVLSLLIMTKQVMTLLIIPTLLLKDKRKIMKRFTCLIIPFEILFWYLLKNNALYYFMDYTIFGLFDFGAKNSNASIYLYISLAAIIVLIYKFLKTKDKTILYCLCFQIVAAPIFDRYHTTLAIIAFIYCLCNNSGRKLKIVTYIIASLFFIDALFNFYLITIDEKYYFNTNRDKNHYLTLGNYNVDEKNNKLFDYYYSKIDDYDIYFILHEMYFYKLKEGVEINRFDLVALGNNGYNGNEKLKNKIKKMNSNTLFIVYEKENENKMFDQNNYEIIEFITNNYEKIDNILPGFNVYQITND